ncbi:MAG: PQQ-binding-like beta-propeller repeat protein [Thermoguttaceae bacterium]
MFLILLLSTLVLTAIADDAESPLPTPDRAISRRIEQAENFVKQERWSDAVNAIGSLLEGEVDLVVDDSAAKNIYRKTLRDRLTTLLISLPNDAQRLYRDQYEPLAQRFLDEAITSNNVYAIAKVADRYPLTESGAEAAMREASARFARGETVAVIHRLKRLEESRLQLDPTLSLLAAAANLALGKRNDANVYIDSIFRRDATTTIKLDDGTIWTADRRDELLTYITPQTNSDDDPRRLAAWLADADWRQTGGTPWQVSNVETTPPILDAEWSVPTLPAGAWRREAERLVPQFATSCTLPAAEPLVIGDTIIARGFDATIGIDIATGKRLWYANEASTATITSGTNPTFAPLRVPREQLFAQRRPVVLGEMLWRNRLYNALTSHGEMFFQVESIPFLQSPQIGMPRGPFVPRRDAANTANNRLTARRVATGELVWKHGKQDANASSDTSFIDEQTFLGPPVPIDDERLVVVSESGGTIRLLTLDAKTGQHIATQPLATTFGPAIRLTAAEIPALRSGVVVCQTGVGVVAAVDSVSCRPLWTHVYRSGDETKENAPFSPVGDDVQWIDIPRLAWQRPATILTSRFAIIAPADAPILLCLDLVNGEIVWKHERLNEKSLIGIASVTENEVFVLTPDALVGINLADGEWTTNTASLRPDVVSALPTLKLPSPPVGFGVASGDVYWLPLADGRIIGCDLVNKTVGDVEWRPASPNSGDVLGNLVAVRGRLVSASPLGVTLFTQRRTLENAATSAPDDVAKNLADARLARQRSDLDAAYETLYEIAATSPRAARLLEQTVLDGLASDFDNFANRVLAACDKVADSSRLLLAYTDGILARPMTGARRRDLETSLARLVEIACEGDVLIEVTPQLRVRLSLLVEERLGLAREHNVGEVAARLALRKDEPSTLTQRTEREDVAESFDWISGNVTVTTRPLEQAVRGVGANVGRIVIPSVGTVDPCIEKLQFVLEISETEQRVLCVDHWGNTVWEWDDSSVGDLAGENIRSQGAGEWAETTFWYTSCGNLLVVALGRTLIALDVSDAQPTSLWTRRLSEPLVVRRLPMTIPLDQVGTILNRWGNGRIVTHHNPAPVLLTQTRLIVAEDDSETITALDPLTGETVWERRGDGQLFAITGNDDSLFLVRANRREVVNVDLATGRECGRATVPLDAGRNVLAAAGTNLLTLTNKTDAAKFEIGVVSLATLCDESQDAYRVLQDNLPSGSVIRFLGSSDAAAILTPSEVLHRIDVATGDVATLQLVPDDSDTDASDDNNGPKSVRFKLFDLDVIPVDDASLVFLLERRAFVPPADAMRRLPPRDQTIRPVNWGRLALYGRDGKPVWERPTLVQNTFQLLEVPSCFPLLVFAAIVVDANRAPNDAPNSAPNEPMRIKLALTAIDKRTGRVCFSEIVDTPSVVGRIVVTGDPESHTLRMTTPVSEILFQFP